MSTAGAAVPSTELSSRSLGVRQAAFIGIGAMAGAGIFSLLGAAGEVAGAAVWLSFLIAGGVVDEPATAVTLAAILVLSIAVDRVWKRRRGDRDAGVRP